VAAGDVATGERAEPEDDLDGVGSEADGGDDLEDGPASQRPEQRCDGEYEGDEGAEPVVGHQMELEVAVADVAAGALGETPRSPGQSEHADDDADHRQGDPG